MAKIMKDGENIEFGKVREMVREELISRYGSVSDFLNSEKGTKFGGMKIKIYLYDKGPVNFNVIEKLCKFLGLGNLSRKVVVSRTVFYKLQK